MPSAKSKRCKKGTRRNKKTGECDPVNKKTKSLKSASFERRKLKKHVQRKISKANRLYLESLMKRILKTATQEGDITNPIFQVLTEHDGKFVLQYDDNEKKYKVVHFNLVPILEHDKITNDEVIQTLDNFQTNNLWSEIFYYYPDTSKIDFIEARVYTLIYI